MKTSVLKKAQFEKKWHLIDAENISVGRLASRITLILKGKNKPQFSPHLPVGDGVIVINSDKIKEYHRNYQLDNSEFKKE